MIEPLVSIIIPVYNGSNYLREAINSALAQTYKNIEVIVVNDGSDDNGETEKIARSYGNEIRYFSKENGGVSSALNLGIMEMRGDYFSWLSHDDVYEIDKVEKQVNSIINNCLDNDTLICCNYYDIDSSSNPIKKIKRKTRFIPSKIYKSKDVLAELLSGSTFNGCSLLIPKKALIDCGLFDESLRFCQDALMWYKIFMREYSLYCIDGELVKNRVHAGQLTQKGQHLFRKECENISGILVNGLIELSTKENNFLQMYIISDAKHLKFSTVREIIRIGRTSGLVSLSTSINAYSICLYGHIRPLIRKVYYAVFRGIKTA